MMRRGSRRAARRTVRRARRRRVRMRRRRMMLAGGMVAIAVAGTATAVKMSKKDADRIEQHTGKKPEDLNEAELEQAMNDLEIDTEELSDAEVASLEAAEAEPAAAQPASGAPSKATPSPAVASTQADYTEELKKLAELRDMNIITNEEFEAKKKKLLGL